MLSSSRNRVLENTSKRDTQTIFAAADARVRECAQHPERIDERLKQLDREWDIERAVEAIAPSLVLTGLVLGATVSRKWLWLSAGVAGFLLQHAIQGWCPPLIPLRKVGFRTPGEIDEEKVALKALRGDFRDASSPDDALRAVRS